MVTKIPSRATLFPGQLVPLGSIIPYLGATPPNTAVSPASATLTFGDTEFDDVADGTLILISADGTSRTYMIKNDYGATTSVQFNAGASASAAAANMKGAIEHAENHAGKLTVVQADGQLTITQVVSGDSGNTVITPGSSFNDSCDVNIGARFTGGFSKGWLYCDGSAISRVSYDALFAAIGTTYGAGDESTTFNLPDLRGRMVVGRDDMGADAASGRIVDAAEGIDGASLGAVGGKIAVTDAGKSQGIVCNWIIRASSDD
jgi:hypothetical protein